jgi:LacI family transcriptional regulator
MAQVTIFDVAKLAGVSKSSASAVLNGGQVDLFRPATVEKVLKAARELGYQAHAGARLMRQSRSNLVGIATRTDILEWHTVASLTIAAHKELTRQGLQAVLVSPEQMVPGESFAPFPSPEMLAGIISVDLAMERSVPSFYKVLGERLPIVALYPLHESAVDCITTDRTAGIVIAFEHLWELGHRHIAFAEIGIAHSLTATAKMRGWQQICEKYNSTGTQLSYIELREDKDPIERGMILAKQIIDMRAEDRPTALICGGDEIALVVLSQFASAGLRVPDDISVVGFDNVRETRYSYPPLTTISQPIAEVAAAAVTRLKALLKLKATDRQLETACEVLIEPQLIVRESTKAPRKLSY